MFGLFCSSARDVLRAELLIALRHLAKVTLWRSVFLWDFWHISPRQLLLCRVYWRKSHARPSNSKPGSLQINTSVDAIPTYYSVYTAACCGLGPLHRFCRPRGDASFCQLAWRSKGVSYWFSAPPDSDYLGVCHWAAWSFFGIHGRANRELWRSFWWEVATGPQRWFFLKVAP